MTLDRMKNETLIIYKQHDIIKRQETVSEIIRELNRSVKIRINLTTRTKRLFQYSLS